MSALLTDRSQLTMPQAHLQGGMTAPAVLELFVRKLPAQRNLAAAAGLEQALETLETLSFDDEEIGWLKAQGSFSTALIDHLRSLRFTGDVDAMPEGTVCVADEPIPRATAALQQAQRVDFGMRRAHGAEAARIDAAVA